MKTVCLVHFRMISACYFIHIRSTVPVFARDQLAVGSLYFGNCSIICRFEEYNFILTKLQ